MPTAISPPVILHRNAGAAIGANVGASAETAIYTTPFIQQSFPAGQGNVTPLPIKIAALFSMTAGTGTTAIVVRVRQGSGTGGALVGISASQPLAAGVASSLPISVQDNTQAANTPTGIQYTITAAQTAGTGAGTTNYLEVEVSG